MNSKYFLEQRLFAANSCHPSPGKYITIIVKILILIIFLKIIDAGSDLQGIRTRAKRDGEDFILNGSKVFITNGILADVVIVVALTDPTAKSKAHGITLFVVEEGMKGFKKGRNLNKLGLKGHDTAELYFEDVRLPKTAILGGENRGFYQLMTELPQERLALGVSSIAACEWMFEETRNYINTRKGQLDFTPN